MTSRKIQPAPSTPNRSIRVVNHDAAATDSLTDILSAEGYSVAIAKNGKKALKRLRGCNCCRDQLKDAKLRDIPVVVMTGASV
jgi:DNA-binding response OmpR family regulator